MQKLILIFLKFYKQALSPYLKAQCKFYPTCSEYAMLAIKKFGIVRGIFKIFGRLIRCNPFSKGGIDFP